MLSFPYIIWRQKSGFERLLWSAIWAGATGNGLDRMFRGEVLDFLYLWPWPVFNVADLCIVFGASALMISTILQKKR